MKPNVSNKFYKPFVNDVISVNFEGVNPKNKRDTAHLPERSVSKLGRRAGKDGRVAFGTRPDNGYRMLLKE